jgi:hypothetical protein
VSSEFRSNDASQGAGMYLRYSSGLIDGNSFFDNTGTVHGGGVYLYSGDETISNNLFVDNSCSWRGGAICVVVNTAPTIVGNTIVGGSGSEGGGIYAGSETGVVDMHNNIITGFTDGYGIYYGNYPGSPSPVSECNDLFANLPGNYYGLAAGTHDIADDALFCDAAAGDYSLDTRSPCAPAHQPTCGLMGAFGVACGPTASESRSWGNVKVLYR